MFSYIICTLFSEKNWKKSRGNISRQISIQKKREQWCLQVCVPKGQRQQPTVHLCLHWYAHRPLTLACDISLQTSWIDLVKRCGCFLLLDGRYSPLAEVVPVLFQCSTAPTSHSRIDSYFQKYVRHLVRVTLLTIFPSMFNFLRYYADILFKCLFGFA